MIWQTDRFHKSASSAGRIGMRQQDAVYTCRQNLREHPRVRTNCSLIDAVDWNIHNDGGRTVPALCRPGGGETLHVFSETFDVVRSMFHVITDVVSVRLSILLTLIETALRTGMRSGVVDRLSLGQQLYRSIDAFCFRSLRHSRCKSQRQNTRQRQNGRKNFFHGAPWELERVYQARDVRRRKAI